MAVSSLGRRRLDSGHIDFPEADQKGYCRIRVKGKTRSMHILIAAAFDLPRKRGQNSVDHIDQNPSNNHISNLRYATTTQQNNNRTIPPKNRTGASCNEPFVLPGEIWRPIPHFPGYAISSLGRFRTKRWPRTSFTPKRNKGEVYARVMMGSRQLQAVHRLVALTFCHKPSGWSWEDPSKWTVDHVDGDPENNEASNLEWVTQAENIRRSKANPLRKSSAAQQSKAVLGCQRGKGKRWRQYDSLHAAATALGLDPGSIGHCLTGRRHHTGEYEFCYAPNSKVRDLPGERWVELTDEILDRAEAITAGTFDDEESEDGEEGEGEGDVQQHVSIKKRARE